MWTRIPVASGDMGTEEVVFNISFVLAPFFCVRVLSFGYHIPELGETACRDSLSRYTKQENVKFVLVNVSVHATSPYAKWLGRYRREFRT